jgi:hypothetical protein
MKSRDIPPVYSLHTKAISDLPVVCEYKDVFPEELPGLPPDRDVDRDQLSARDCSDSPESVPHGRS